MNGDLEQFEAAMTLEPRKRAAFSEVACSNDEQLGNKLDSLITFHASMTGAASNPDNEATKVVGATTGRA